MKKIIRTAVMLLIAAMMLTTAMAETGTSGIPADRTDLTEEDFLGTWTLKKMILEGYEVPIDQLGLTGSITVTAGKIEITGTSGEPSVYETAFEEGCLTYMEGEEKMAVAITEDGMLHIDIAAKTFKGTAEDEGAPEIKKNGAINLGNLNAGVIGQYYVKAE